MSFEEPFYKPEKPKSEIVSEQKPREIDHLDLVKPLPIGRDGLVPLAAEVNVDFLGQKQSMLFADYLHFIGADYIRYQRAIKDRPGDDFNTILKDLHRQIIRERLARAAELHLRFTQESATSINRQVDTTKDHGRVFDMIINDLELDGLSVESAPNDVDYLDGIDHLLTFNHKALMDSQREEVEDDAADEVEDKNFFIGVQRTFDSSKRKDVINDPVRILPSANGKGVVFRIFLLEKPSDYEDEKKETLMEKLDAIRRAAAKKEGLSPIEYGLKHRRQGYAGVYKVLRGGQEEQVRRATRVFEEIKNQLNAYINGPEFKKQTEYVQGYLIDMRDNLHLEDYSSAIQSVEE